MTAIGVRHATVIGGGTMGSGIAASLLVAGYRVEIVEVDPAVRELAGERVRKALEEAVRRGKIEERWPSAEEGPIVRASIAETVHEPAAIIEAAPEDLALKREILAAAEARSPAVLASNTSAISIDSIAAGLRRPEAFLGMHFFNPVMAMQLVELVVGGATSEATLAAARRIVEALGKEAIEVRDAPGFASSRLGVCLGLEAIRMVEEDVAGPESIDRAMELGYRHPVGPLKLSDIVGLDVRYAIALQLSEEYGSRFSPPPLMKEMLEEGRLGKKSGSGFYDWETGAPQADGRRSRR